MLNRYFVDQRVGCIAIRDSFKTDPDYQGLHSDSIGVIHYRHGYFKKIGRDSISEWFLDEKDIDELHRRCDDLNELNQYAEIPPCGAD